MLSPAFVCFFIVVIFLKFSFLFDDINDMILIAEWELKSWFQIVFLDGSSYFVPW